VSALLCRVPLAKQVHSRVVFYTMQRTTQSRRQLGAHQQVRIQLRSPHTDQQTHAPDCTQRTETMKGQPGDRASLWASCRESTHSSFVVRCMQTSFRAEECRHCCHNVSSGPWPESPPLSPSFRQSTLPPLHSFDRPCREKDWD